MRILVVSPIPPDPRGRGGVPRVVDAQVAGLRRDHEVAVLTVAGPEPHELAAVRRLAMDGVEIRAIERAEPQAMARWRRRARFARLWLGGRLPWRSVWFWERGVQRALQELLGRDRFDLLAVEDSAMAAYDYGQHVPTVFTEHEVRRPRPIARPSRARLANVPRWALGELDWRRWRSYQIEAWRSFDRVHVFTERDARAVRALAPDVRPLPTPFGLRLPDLHDSRRERPDTMLMVGNFTHLPNVDAAEWLVQDILPRVRTARPRAALVIAGARPPQRILRLGCGHVDIVDSPDDVRPLLERAAVVVSPIRIGGGMRVKSVEALAFGKPLVATPRAVDGFPMGKGERPVAVGETPGELAAAAVRLLADPDERARLGVAARAYAECHLSAEAYASRLEASYREVLRSGRADG